MQSDSWTLGHTLQLLSETRNRPDGCRCLLGNYWRVDLIPEKHTVGLADGYGQVLCPACRSQPC